MFSLIYGFWKMLFTRTEFHILILGIDHAGKTVRPPFLQISMVVHPQRSRISFSSSPLTLRSQLCVCVAKQSLLERVKAIFTGLEPLPPGKIPPTVGLNIGRMQVNCTKLIFWDLGGGSNLRSLWEKCVPVPSRRRPQFVFPSRVSHAVLLSLTVSLRRYFSEAHGLLYVVDASDAKRLDESRDVLRQLLHRPERAGIPVLVMANKQDAQGAITPHEIQDRFGLQTAVYDGSSQPQNVLGVTALNGDGVEEGIHWLVDVVRSSPRAAEIASESWRLAH